MSTFGCSKQRKKPKTSHGLKTQPKRKSLELMSTNTQIMQKDAGARINCLDGVRGAAAISVVAGHLTDGFIAVPGVYLFFILSAFLLSSYFFKRSITDTTSIGSLVYFFQRRFFRIFPLFFAIVLSSAIVTSFLSTNLGGIGIPATVTKDQLLDVLLLQSGPEFLWTIPVEVKFYLFLPLIVFVMAKLNVLSRYLGDFSLLVAILVGFLTIEKTQSGVSLLSFLPIFLCGILLHRIHHWYACLCEKYAPTSTQFRQIQSSFKALGLAALLCWAFSMPIVHEAVLQRSIERDVIAKSHAAYSVLFMLLISGVTLGGQGLIRTLFETRLATWLGNISFSLYLVHVGFIRGFDLVLPNQPHIAGVLAVACSLSASTLIYRRFEHPILIHTQAWLKPHQA
ncbi:putative acyltransferase protein [gamma proteobacterium NOR5-3]|nr:putative acyltransferase protein [gamma proteobacterium NOR5-3]